MRGKRKTFSSKKFSSSPVNKSERAVTMTRGAFLKKYFMRFAVTLTLAGLIVYTVYHVFASTSGSLMKTPVQMYDEIQTVGGEAYLFRDEDVLTVSSAGLINDSAESGVKVSKGVKLTEVYIGGNAEDLTAVQTELDRLNRLIGVLEDSAVSADTTLSKAGSYRAEANTDYLAIRQAVTAGDWSQVSQLEASMLTALNKYGVLTNSNTGIDETLASLKEARSKLLTGTPVTLQNSKASGYFYSRTYVDGYEALFTTDALESLTPERFAELTASEPIPSEDRFAVGKMVYDYDWHLAISFDASAAGLFAEGGEYAFAFPENRDTELTLTCTGIHAGSDGAFVAVFSTDEVPSNFVYLRRQHVEITVGSCSGYHIPESALHTVNGVEGVYIFEESTVYFRRVEILYRGDGYCIAAQQGDRGDEYLALHDILVTSGKDLYDGRVYR